MRICTISDTVFIHKFTEHKVSKHESLQARLRKKMAEAGFSAHALEKQAGLKRSAVQNILYGKSKKPSAEILGAITKILGCSISELLNQQQENVQLKSNYLLESHADMNELDTALYAKAVQVANNIFQAHQINLNKQDALNYINEIYQYALNSHQTDIDIVFAEWLAKKITATH